MIQSYFIKFTFVNFNCFYGLSPRDSTNFLPMLGFFSFFFTLLTIGEDCQGMCVAGLYNIYVFITFQTYYVYYVLV